MASGSRPGRYSSHSHPSRLMRALAWVVLLTFLAGCTKDVVRGPMDTRHYAVDMAQLDARRMVTNNNNDDNRCGRDTCICTLN